MSRHVSSLHNAVQCPLPPFPSPSASLWLADLKRPKTNTPKPRALSSLSSPLNHHRLLPKKRRDHKSRTVVYSLYGVGQDGEEDEEERGRQQRLPTRVHLSDVVLLCFGWLCLYTSLGHWDAKSVHGARSIT